MPSEHVPWPYHSIYVTPLATVIGSGMAGDPSQASGTWLQESCWCQEKRNPLLSPALPKLKDVGLELLETITRVSLPEKRPQSSKQREATERIPHVMTFDPWMLPGGLRLHEPWADIQGLRETTDSSFG